MTPAPSASALTLEVQSRTLRLAAQGHVDAPGVNAGKPEAFWRRLRWQLMVDPEGLFTEPVTFRQGAMDLRLRLDPFRLDVGQASLQEGPLQLSLSGRAEVGEAG